MVSTAGCGIAGKEGIWPREPCQWLLGYSRLLYPGRSPAPEACQSSLPSIMMN